MEKNSAGLLMYRRRGKDLQVLLVHPGGPFWVKKNTGAWSIPKGLYTSEEEPLSAARREFEEETSFPAEGEFIPLGRLKQKSGKLILAWAFEGDCDAAAAKSNMFSMEWPPRSGKQQEFPEADRAEWFGIEEAKEKIHPGQKEFLSRLQDLLSNPHSQKS
ncbi:MAG TPA: NUDIX domain-containing protein [Dissulfurispiraceae bacterium]